MSRIIEVGEDILAMLRANARSVDESEADVLHRLLRSAAQAPTPSDNAEDRVPRQRRAGRQPEETLHGLMSAGLVEPGDVLLSAQGGRKLRAVVAWDGRLRTMDGAVHASPGSALEAAFGDDTDAWARWHHVATARTLAELRELATTCEPA